MDTDSLIPILIGLLAAAVSGVAGYFVRKIYAERLIRTAESKAREILVKAKREAEDNLAKADKEARGYLAGVQQDFDQRMAQQRKEIEQRTRALNENEAKIEQKLDSADRKEKEALFKLQEATAREKSVEERQKEVDALAAQERAALERLSGMNAETAKKEFLKRLEADVREDSGRLIRQIEDAARAEADDKARKILGLAMQRLAGPHTIESTVTVVHLPSEDLKGRIIGKDGRNIRSFETLTGVDLLIDDTPDSVTLSAFDGVRREIARLALEELLKDGRIHPARIEEVVQKTKRGMEFILKDEGEKALLEAGVSNMHPELVKLLGRLKFRSSYGQNILAHSIEVASVMQMIAVQMKIDPILAKRAGLLHDIGKAVSADVEGPHALIGGELARRYNEHPDVVHGIEAHHEDIEMRSFWPMLVQAADAVSAARPGARRESFENYAKRVTALEAIADAQNGVEKSYAIQAGREIRVVVKPEKVSEDALPALAREIKKKIEADLQFPGQIKVVVIRETRVEDIAK